MKAATDDEAHCNNYGTAATHLPLLLDHSLVVSMGLRSWGLLLPLLLPPSDGEATLTATPLQQAWSQRVGRAWMRQVWQPDTLAKPVNALGGPRG
jgi:hypothetical protein